MSAKNKAKKSRIMELNISIGGVSLTEKAVFAKHLSVMLKSGLTIAEALDITRSQARGKFKKIISVVFKSVESGNSLYSSLAKFKRVFSPLFINTVKAGEASGNLERNIQNLAEQLEKDKELVNKVKGALLYPAVIFSGAVILGLVMVFLVLPKIMPLFQGLKIDLPPTTRALIWLSGFIQLHGTAVFSTLIIAIAAIIWIVRQKFAKPVTHYFFLHTPIVNKISQNANLANFCRTLGTLLKSGLSIDEALDISRDTVSNYYYKKSLFEICQRVRRGSKLSEILSDHENLFPRLASSMIRVGEKSGNLEDSLFYLAVFYDSEVDMATKNLSTAIEPILLVIIGIAVAVLALSIITPIYKITGNIQR